MKPTELIRFIDLTRLHENDYPEQITALCQQARTPYGNVAAICVYPQFVQQVRDSVNTEIPVATVANFPSGDNAPLCFAVIQQALSDGAAEIDVVLPYMALIAGQTEEVLHFIQTCRALCANALLKIILETGELVDEQLITQAALLCIEAKVDFIKTSTGKTETGATLAAVATIANTIKKQQAQTGIKVSGGVSTVTDALAYAELVQQILGKDWLQPAKLRFGSSKLIAAIGLEN